jgi:hypothetical protein
MIFFLKNTEIKDKIEKRTTLLIYIENKRQINQLGSYRTDLLFPCVSILINYFTMCQTEVYRRSTQILHLKHTIRTTILRAHAHSLIDEKQ